MEAESTGKKKDVIRPNIEIRRNYNILFSSSDFSGEVLCELPEICEVTVDTVENMNTFLNNLKVMISTIKSVTTNDKSCAP